MEFLTFEELQAQIQQLYHDGEYASALELATYESKSFPEQAHLLSYWRISLAARLGEQALALALLRQVLDNGFWYGETLLRKSPALSSLQGLPEFEDLLLQNAALQAAEPVFPLLILRSQGRCEAGGLPCPVLIALHENGSNAQDSVVFWRPAALAGWLVAVPQSTQAMWKRAYTWDDREAAQREILKHYNELLEKYNIDPRNVVLAGHGMGGETAIGLALSGVGEACGFLAIDPEGPLMSEPEAWLTLVKDRQAGELRGYILFGEEDEALTPENIEILVETMTANGIPCEIEAVPHAGHDFAPEFEDALLRGLEFITQA